MNKSIIITINHELELEGQLNNTRTAGEIYQNLPLQGVGETWGEEIYFSTSIKVEPENPLEVLNEGDLAYWPPMQAFCIFYGPTPAGRETEVKAAGPVNVFGKISEEGIKSLKETVKSGPVKIKVESR